MTDPFFKKHRAIMAIIASALHKLGPMGLGELRSMDTNISRAAIELMQSLSLVTSQLNCGNDEVFKVSAKGVRKFSLNKAK
jgi:hypothetical protein